MKSLNQIVYSVIEFVSGFKVTDDNPFEPDLIAAKVHDVRSLLIKQGYTAEKTVDDLYYQSHVVDIKQEDVIPGKKNGMVYFYANFPALLTNVDWYNIKYLGKANMTEKYNRRSMDGYVAAKGRTWSKDYVDYTVIGNSKALIKDERLAKQILVIGLFSDPTSVPGFDWDTDYPVPDPFKLEMIIKQDIMAALGVKPDEKNDAKHNIDELLTKHK